MNLINSIPFAFRASRVGAEARRLTANPGFSGKVLAVASKTIYLTGENGEMLWISGSGLSMHRRSIQASFPTSLFNPGERFIVRQASLWIERDIAINLDQAAEWNPKSIEPGEAVLLALVKEGMNRLWTAIPMLGNFKGFGKSLPLISLITMKSHPTHFTPDLPINNEPGVIMEVVEACLTHDMIRALQKGRNLVGLGEGLTPSGDDFLGGLLFAIHSLQRSYPEEFHWEREAIIGLLEWAQKETNPISYALLKDLAFGHGPETLHEALHALLMGSDLERVKVRIKRLTEMGSTSGWDMLAGLMTGMLLVKGKRNHWQQ